MKKKIIGLMLLLALFCSMVTPAYAETFTGSDSWSVSFNQNKEMVSNFKTSDIDDVIMGMQPGDNAIISLQLTNSYSATTNWYMTNKVIDSLEDGSLTAKGGAYTYTLIYDGPGGQKVLFDSDTVGGEHVSQAGEGLNEATNALEDFFYLDTLKTGETGTITLKVVLDGESQGNDYQDTLANLQMNFAVELEKTQSPTKTPSIVKTGDENNVVPYIVTAGISGVLLLLFALFSLNHNRRQKKEDK